MPRTKPINEAQVAQRGLAVVEATACDDQTAFATQELLAGRSRPVRDTEVSVNTGGRVAPGQACLRLSSRGDGVPGGSAGVVAAHRGHGQVRQPGHEVRPPVLARGGVVDCPASSSLTVFQLPTYAPDLNPQEGVWSLVKRDIGNLAAADLGQLTRAVKRKLKTLQYRPEVIDGCLAGTGLVFAV
ncbi:DUF6207 family protein [Streptomyces sp. NPDC019990]|uniref:DUF6207 family protein n=1 Tax=Streptomyces sp. NPDC019990 TaxID=3154693 RepID=UPI0033E4CA17